MGTTYVWRDKAERWHHDCVGAKKKQGPTVMCCGMIGYGWKGPFHVWETETEEERKEAEIEIARINAEMAEEAERANAEWRASPEWLALRERVLEQLGFNVLLRKPEPQIRKFRNLGVERSSGSTKSNGQRIKHKPRTREASRSKVRMGIQLT